MKKKIKIDRLQKGDIILTTTAKIPSVVIRKLTKSDISHAMLCVEHGSIIHAVPEGVRSENPQRLFFDGNLPVHVMRLTGSVTADDIQTVINYVRSKIGSEYAYLEAARAWKERGKKLSARQFCSRLIAQGYAEAGHQLVNDPNFCTPGQLCNSPLLVEVPNMTVEVSPQEIEFWENHPSAPDIMNKIQNNILKDARKLSHKIQDFNDLGRFVISHADYDLQVAEIYSKHGYLEFWRYDVDLNPWHYDLTEMMKISSKDLIRQYCNSTVSGEDRNHNRFTQTLTAYEDAHRKWPRHTFDLLIQLYKILAANHAQRYDVAAKWLDIHKI